MAGSPNTYCALEDLQNLLSAASIDLRTDDAPPDLLGDVIAMASDEIDTLVWNQYSPVQLTGNTVVTHWCSVIASAFLCLRRGNDIPSGLMAHYNRVMDHLEKVERGIRKIPYCVRRKSFVPTLSTMRATMAPFPRSVVEKSRSTGTPQNYHQAQDVWDKLGFNNDAILDYAI